MLKKLVLICFMIAMIPAIAGAADIFVRPKTELPEGTVKPYDAPDKTPLVQKAAPAPVAPPVQEQAAPAAEAPSATPNIPELQAPEQTPVEPQNIEEMANTYYRNCMAKQHPMLDGENQQLLCGCTSAKIPEVMTFDQMKAMGEDTPEGLEQRNRMMLLVYTPCIEYPTRSMVLYRCLDNGQLKAVVGNTQPICSCLANNMALFMREKAGPAIELAIKRNQKDIDPLGMLMQSRGYERAETQTLHGCMENTNYQLR